MLKIFPFPLTAVGLLPFIAAGGGPVPGDASPLFVYVGTYTRGESKGIHLFEMNRETGEMIPRGLAAETVNPSFVALHPNGSYLYAVGEMSDSKGRKAGAVSAFAVDPASGRLELLNQQLSGGGGPCHVAVDPAGTMAVVANYAGGSISAFPLREDGRLGECSAFFQHEGSGPNERRQKAPHAHSAFFDHKGRFVWAVDLGIDKVLIYRREAGTTRLAAHSPPHAKLAPGAGPRHLAFTPCGRFAYVINELDSTVTAFACDLEQGVLREIQCVRTLPEGWEGTNWPAEILVHPSGQFLYGTNRGHDSLVILSIDGDGRLSLVGHEPTRGKNPRNFGIDPSGRFLVVANQDTGNLVPFRIDPQSGRLNPTGQTLPVDLAVCVRFR